MLDIIASVTEEELRFIAGLDHGQNAERHFDALNDLIFMQSCEFLDNQRWYPYEVIELGAHWLQPLHEREFTICTLLVIHAVHSGYDNGTDLDSKLAHRSADYDTLPTELSAAILDAYARAGC